MILGILLIFVFHERHIEINCYFLCSFVLLWDQLDFFFAMYVFCTLMSESVIIAKTNIYYFESLLNQINKRKTVSNDYDDIVFGKYVQTHIMLDRRTTMMAFIQCTDLHAATGHAGFLWLYKEPLNQDYSNSTQQYRLFHHRD